MNDDILGNGDNSDNDGNGLNNILGNGDVSNGDATQDDLSKRREEREIRQFLSALETEDGPPVPDGFADQLWSELDTPSVTKSSRRVSYLGWVAAAAIVVIAGIGALVLIDRNDGVTVASSTDEPGSVADTDPDPDETVPSEAPETTVEPEPVELDFVTPISVVGLDHQSVSVSLSATTDTVFNAVLRQDGNPVDTVSAAVGPGEEIQADFNRLESSTRYTVEVILLGPPTIESERLEFITPPDPDDPNAVAEPIEIGDIDVAEITATSAEISFTTTLCANASFVVLELANQTEVARFDGAETGCVSEHVVFPGVDTAPLVAETDYLVLITAETNGRGLGNGNSITESVTITTEAG